MGTTSHLYDIHFSLQVVDDHYQVKKQASCTVCIATAIYTDCCQSMSRGMRMHGQEVRHYLAYATQDKVGLLLLPHTGNYINPHNASCLLAHPSKQGICASLL